ncbi:MAG: hypothetical protein K1Y02_11480 [Candidatus Hydrogenedentes bacterium]|nr:hypothetical protein [Candidatus Hydrogenedentota bacterium]
MTWKTYLLAAVIVTALVPTAGAVVSLVDASGVQFDINTDVTFTTSVSASGAAKEAEYTTSVTGVTTSLGGTTTALLTNGVEGYAGLLVNGVAYNQNGTVTTTCEGETSFVDRQVVFAPQTIGNLTVQRKVFVPEDDAFCRWLNVVQNNSGSSETVTVTLVGTMGAGTNTLIGSTSTAPLDTATTSDRWVVTFKDYDGGGLSNSPRLGHVLYGPGRRIAPSTVSFVNNTANVSWEYSFSLPAGQTYIFMTLLTAKPSISDAEAKCSELLTLPEPLFTCMSATEKGQVVNFDLIAPTVTITSSTTETTSQNPIPVTVTFSESVTGFDVTDLDIGGCTAQDFDGSGTTYTFDLVPNISGQITVDIPEGSAKDAGGNPNKAATQFKRTVDTASPSVAISSVTPNPSSISTVIQVLVTFSEPVTGFTQSDIIVTGAQFHSSNTFSGEDAVYTFNLLPVTVTGPVTITIPDNVCQDDAGNYNTGGYYQHGVSPGASCFASAKAGNVPLQAGLTGLAPLGLAALGLVLAELQSRRRRNRS